MKFIIKIAHIVIYLLAVISKKLTNTQKTMSIVWGKPLTGVSFVNWNVTSWEACVQFCYDSTNCIFVYNRGYNVSTEGCEVYDYNMLGTVQQLTEAKAKGAKVAFKLKPATTCQSGTNPPTFTKNSAVGVVEVPSKPTLKPSFTVTLASGVWSVGYNGNSFCYGVSSLSLRPGAAVCLVYSIMNTTYALTAANNFCKTYYNGSITGVDNLGEINMLYSVFMNKEGTNKERVVWLDGRRRVVCQGDDWNTRAACDKLLGFKFTDPYRTNSDYYVWEDGAPFGKECLVMWANSASNPSRVGKIRDIDCNATCTKSICPIGVSCWALTL